MSSSENPGISRGNSCLSSSPGAVGSKSGTSTGRLCLSSSIGDSVTGSSSVESLSADASSSRISSTTSGLVVVDVIPNRPKTVSAN